MPNSPCVLSTPLILASASPMRHKMLQAIQLPHQVIASPVDENQEKTRLMHLTIAEQAQMLAQLKGQAVSIQHPHALVLAADQIGEYSGEPLFKPLTREKNIGLLEMLSGQDHRQHTAACLLMDGKPLGQFYESVTLTMRTLSLPEIIAYVDIEKPWDCCGGYRFEGLGKHLFTHVDGNADSVLGLQLLPILTFLYEKGYLTLQANGSDH